MLDGVNPELKAVAVQQGGVFSRGQALDAGYTVDQINRRLQSKRWQRIRRGQYAEAVDLSGQTPWDRALFEYRRRIHAAVNAMRPGSWAVSHHSSVVMHELPVWGASLDDVHLTRLGTVRCGPIAGVRHHRSPVAAADLVEVGKLVLTAPPRALVEYAKSVPFEAAVISVDAALHRGLVDSEQLGRALDATMSWAGAPSARAAFRFADGRSESVGESRCRVMLHQLGLPVPQLQVDFEDADGLVGRVDFYFPEFATAIEFDGDVKYADGDRGVLVREKWREDRLRALGLRVIRVGWSDLTHPHRLAVKLRPHLAVPHLIA